MADGVEVIPSAKRLIRSLRDMGYEFAAAVADLVDNSIEAGATRVDIDVEFDGDDSWVRIADNGKGMTPPELREAMRYGAEREYEDDDLGKFGLGLKTASMSQCTKLSVASRWNADRADIAAYCWDLEHIERTNRWEILPLDRNGLGPTVRLPLKDNPGTVVLWQRLDRILGYRHPYGESARKRLSQMCRELEDHLAMVFHRFLTGEAARSRKLKVLVNGNEVRVWDPFCKSEEGTRKLESITLDVITEDVAGEIRIDPFVLPHQDDFSSPEAFRRASGPAGWNQQQGFYIYRGGRMIQSGGWCRLRKPDEHTKLARVGISFLPVLDESFKINVAKMRVQLPAAVKDDIDKAITPVVRLAREVYDRKNKKIVVAVGPTGGARRDDGARPGRTGEGSVPATAEIAAGRPTDGDASPVMSLDEFVVHARAVATAEEQPVVNAVVERLRRRLTRADRTT